MAGPKLMLSPPRDSHRPLPACLSRQIQAKQIRKYIFAAGGTGGHVFPAIAIAQELQRQDPACRICFFGSHLRMESQILPKYSNFEFTSIPVVSLKRPLVSPANLLLPLRLFVAVARAFVMVAKERPDVVIGTGGYVAFPTCVAARLQGVPVVLQEQNAAPGLANSILAMFASTIFVAFQQAQHSLTRTGRPCRCVGNPVRNGFHMEADEGWRSHHRCNGTSSATTGPGGASTSGTAWAPAGSREKLVVFVGGSQGAEDFNALVVEALEGLLQQHPCLRVVWQTGRAHEAAVLQRLRAGQLAKSGAAWEERVSIRPFIEDMPALYREADLVVSRAGAMSCSELLAAGVPSVLLPSPYVAEDHQAANARALVTCGAGVVLRHHEVACDPKRLGREVGALIGDDETLDAMAASAAAAHRPGAARVIAERVAELAGARQQQQSRVCGPVGAGTCGS